MFTGIVQHLGTVTQASPVPQGMRIAVAGAPVSELRPGDSIAVNGVCLTAVTVVGEQFTADVAAETLRKTTLGRLQPGMPVNLELPLRLMDRLGGHLVAGHVDGIGRLLDIRPEGESYRFSFEAPPELRRYLVYKGSIAVDGVSLTVAEVTETGFQVAIIPHTFQVTTLGRLQPGDPVNLETDLIGKYVERLLGGYLPAAPHDAERR